MAGSQSRGFDSPDDTRSMENGKLDVVHLGGATVGRATFQPGWRWSESVKPMVGGDSCQQHHLGYCLSGTLRVQPEGGEAFDIAVGEAYVIEPGHDAWVEGDEPYVALEFRSETVESYGER